MANTLLDLAYVVDAAANSGLTLNGEALALGEFRAVRFTGDTKDPHVTNYTAAASADDAAGVAQFDVLLKHAGAANVTVRRQGITKMVAGEALSVGARVNADALGRAVVGPTGWKVFGIALQNAAAVGEIIDVEVDFVNQATA